MDGAVVSGKCARLRKRTVAQIASERAQVNVPPVMHDQTRALLENAVAAPVATDEVGALLAVVDPDFRVGAGRHSFEPGVGLASDDVLLLGGHPRVGQLVLLRARLDIPQLLQPLLELSDWHLGYARYPRDF